MHCFSFQIRNPILYEFNGTSQYCKSRYSGSLKISPVSEELGPLLERPIEFEYKGGKVGRIYCDDQEPEYILNIKRGILSILHHNFTKPELSVDDEEPRMYKNWEVTYYFIVIVIFLGHSRGKSGTRSILCEAPTLETRPNHNTRLGTACLTLFDKWVCSYFSFSSYQPGRRSVWENLHFGLYTLSQSRFSHTD